MPLKELSRIRTVGAIPKRLHPEVQVEYETQTDVGAHVLVRPIERVRVEVVIEILRGSA